MLRFLSHLLILLTVATTTLAGIPCACAAAGSHEIEDDEPASSCCAGAVDEEDEREDDCPQCLSGACDMTATTNGQADQVLVGAWVNYDFEFNSSHHVGFEAPLDTFWAVSQENTPPLLAPEPESSGKDRCVQNQVIRC